MTKEEQQKIILQQQQSINWLNLFADYIQQADINKYNDACRYANKNE